MSCDISAAESIYPQAFTPSQLSDSAQVYLNDPAAQKLAEFFDGKGTAALKEEDRSEKWYDDWLAFQARHRLYASVLSPAHYSKLGFEFDTLRYARFLELFAYF